MTAKDTKKEDCGNGVADKLQRASANEDECGIPDDGSTRTRNEDYEEFPKPFQLLAAQIELLYRRASTSFYASFFTSILMMVLLWEVVPHARILIWAGITMALYIVRHLLFVEFRRESPTGEDAIPWGNYFACSSAATGFMWGSTVLFLFPQQSEIHQVLLFILLGGMAGGTVLVYAPLKAAYIPAVLFAALPPAGAFLFQGTMQGGMIGGLIVAYVFVLLIVGNRVHYTIKHIIKLRFEKDDYITRLSERNAQAERLNETLKQEIEQRKKAEEAVRQSADEKEILLREIHHRVKNNLAVMAGLLRMQSRRVKYQSEKRMLAEARDRIRAMSIVYEKLHQSGSLVNLNVNDYLSGLAKAMFAAYGGSAERVQLILNIEEADLPIDSIIPLGLLTSELISNSLIHAFPDGKQGRLAISLKSIDGSTSEIHVQDNGIGIPKEVDIRNPKTLGLHLISLFARQLQGVFTMYSDEGTHFAMSFPKEISKAGSIVDG